MAAVIENNLGTMVGWTKVKCRIFGRDVVGIKKIKYSDNQEINNEMGAGSKPIGESEGEYKAECTIEFTIEEILKIQSQLPKGTHISSIPAFPITVSYVYEGVIYTDIIKGCRFKGRNFEAKQGDTIITDDQTFKITEISWNV
ncbi:hypothetical protein EZY14_009315 [Kordia sp. TARA_039_SRF]|nr:hypothetical protein EZY14_009315 [Kordia sp. TARA_039_SRF]